MATIYYPDGTLVRGSNGAVYTFMEGRPRAVTGPLVVGRNGEDISKKYLESLPRLEEQLLEEGPLLEAVMLESGLEVVQQDELQSDMPRRYMRTRAALAQGARRIDCETETWTRQPWFGFTGGVIVFLATGEQDQGGQYLWRSELQQFGVDGFRIPFKRSRRIDTWSQDVPAEVAQQATQIRIAHTHAPRDRAQQQIEETLAVTGDIITIVAAVIALL
jgi:hypothetical protein